MIIYVVGYPRSGNNWITPILGDLLKATVNSPVHPKERNLNIQIIQKHIIEIPNWNGEKIVHIVRNPKDVAVSINFFWNLGEIKRTLLKMCTAEAPMKHKWTDFVERWLTTTKPISLIKYEDLHSNPIATIENLLKELNFSGVNNIKEIYNKYLFNKNNFTNYNWEMPYYRKGIVEDYKNYFTKEDLDLADKCFGNTMKLLDYI